MIKEDWIESTLGGVSVVGAGSPAPQGQEYFEQGSKPFIRVEDMGKLGSNKVISDAEDHLNEKGIKKLKLIPKGSVLFTKSGASTLLNQRALIDRDMYVASHIGFATPYSVVTSNYLYYFMKLIDFGIFAHATTLPSLPLSKAKSIKIPLAPLPEQRAIVSKIEEFFSDLDKGVSDLKKAQDQLKVYRQGVLKKAFEGEAVTNSECKKLISITSKIGSGSTPKGGKKNYKPSGIPLIRSMNIHFNFIKYDELAFIDENQAEKLKNVIVNKGDVLLNITGASIGRVNIAPEEFDNGRVNQHVSIIRPLKDSFVPKYLKYFLQSPDIQHWISNTNYGVTRQALTKGMLENLELPLPSSIEQRQIVQEIETRLSVCDKVEESISESLEKAKALRQSILKKAFEGRLLSNGEIEKCKAAPDYEPAAILLEKIKMKQ